MSEQLQFPFASLDFPGRVSLYAHEVAEKLGVTVQHVLDLVDEAKLVALDLKGIGAGRRCIRIPIEAYRDFVVASLTSPYERARFLRDLPRATLRELLAEIRQLLTAA